MSGAKVVNLGPWPRDLSAAHRKQLEEGSGITAEVAAERGYVTTNDKALLKKLGIAPPQHGDTLLLPLHGVDGKVAAHIGRHDEPRLDLKKLDAADKSKIRKYENPYRLKMRLDVPPRCQPDLSAANIPLVITEGQKKADSGVSHVEPHQACFIALLGVACWRRKSEDGVSRPLEDWDSVELNDRLACIAFDNDMMTKVEVQRELAKLVAFLKSKGALVKVIQFPGGAKKIGLDDFLLDHTIEDMLALATDSLASAPTAPLFDDRGVEDYFEDKGALWLKHFPTQTDLRTEIKLTNFIAHIGVDVRIDDGSGQIVGEYEISATVGKDKKTVPVFRVPATEFDRLVWVSALGAKAGIEIVNRGREHVALAIRKLSDASVRPIYTHTGWIRRDRRNLYLHGGGAICGSGLVTDVSVELMRGNSDLSTLKPFVLPAPPSGEALKVAIRAELKLLDVELAPLSITAMIWSATWRSVLGTADFSLHFWGETGAFKTELVALSMQHFGRGFESRRPPASWHNSALANEELCFVLKDSVCIVDDFKPGGSSAAKAAKHAEADSLFRAAGNAQGRTKLNPDSTVRAARPPRGLIVSTGEEPPIGGSLIARLTLVGVEPGQIIASVLTERQKDAAAGLYEQCMSGYLRWLSPRLDDVHADMRAQLPGLRMLAADKLSASHPRTPYIVADLFFGAEAYLKFAAEVGAITKEEEATYLKNIFEALLEDSRLRNAEINEQKSSRRFIELLVAAFGSGKANLARAYDAEPSPHKFRPVWPADATRWGWRETPPHAWQPFGQSVGWVDDEDDGDLFLNPTAAYQAAQGMVVGSVGGIDLQERALRKRLMDEGLLASTGHDQGRNTPLMQKQLQGQR